MKKIEYQTVAPYVAFQAGQHLEEQLKHYGKSLFDDAARIRLIASLLDSKLERKEMYSLGILLSEVYLSKQHPHEERDPRKNFGEQFFMLYVWLLIYNVCWIVPGIIGLLLFIVDVIVYYSTSHHGFAWDAGVIRSVHLWHVIFAAFLSIFSFIVDSYWNRIQSNFAWQWGTTELTVIEAQRKEFDGEWEKDQVTGQTRKKRQRECLTNFKRAFSFFIIFVLIAIDIAIVVLIFSFISTLKSSWQQTVVALLYAFLVQVLSYLYGGVAKSLNNWENIEFESNYYDALCIKLYLFQFVNSYASLFYIAFVKNLAHGCIDDNCLYELNIQFLVIFGVFWAVNSAKTSFHCLRHCFRTLSEQTQDDPLKIAESEDILRQKNESPLQDHMDFVILYGYVLMFSACFPFAPFLFALTGCIDVIFRLWKRKLFGRRPFPQYAKGIGVWNQIMLIINVIAAFTNSAIIIFTGNYFEDATREWIIFMAASFILLMCKLFVNLLLPATPEIVKLGLQWSNREARRRLLLNNAENSLRQPRSAFSTSLKELNENFADELRGVSHSKSSDDLTEKPTLVNSYLFSS